MRPAMPAAGMEWPIIDLTEPRPARASPWASGPKKARSVSISAWSPTGVAVPCASMRPTVSGARPAADQARSRAMRCPSTRGTMRLDARPSLAVPVPRMTL
jgi:hypothetical protein